MKNNFTYCLTLADSAKAIFTCTTTLGVCISLSSKYFFFKNGTVMLNSIFLKQLLYSNPFFHKN